MSAYDSYADDLDDDYEREPDDDDLWDDDGYEPDPEDAEIARSYAEYAGHCDDVHAGRECDCRPPLADRARNAARRARFAWARLTRRPSDEPPF